MLFNQDRTVVTYARHALKVAWSQKVFHSKKKVPNQNPAHFLFKVEKIFRKLPGFDHLTLIFCENSNRGQGSYWKSWVWIPAPEGQNIFCSFSFHFQILHTKLDIFVFNHFWISSFTNQISIKTKIFNMFHLISN